MSFILPSKTFKNVLSVIIIIVSVVKSSHVKPHRASYGEFCDSEAKIYCNSREFLTCQDRKCSCLKPDAMIYDPVTNSCLTLAGERCSYTITSQDSNEHIQGYNEILNCVTNSKCNSASGICTCNDQFHEESDGTCSPRRQYRGKCSEHKECRRDLNFHCNMNDSLNNGFCDCFDSIYRPDIQKCVGKAGNSCINQQCVVNAHCDTSHVVYGPSVDYELNPDENVCNCNDDFLQSEEGQCIIPHGKTCENTDDLCDKGLKCINEKCVCQYEKHKHQQYVLPSGPCLTFVGGPCTTENDTSVNQCVPHASCKAKKNDAFKCKCNPGFLMNSQRGCDLAFGENCPLQFAQCDRLARLKCINKKCQCQDDLQIFDPNLVRCVGLVGSSCDITLKNKDCTQGAICVPERDAIPQIGICECADGFSFITGNRSCEQEPLSKSLDLQKTITTITPSK